MNQGMSDFYQRYLESVDAIVAADPAVRFAFSLEALQHKTEAQRIGLDLVADYASIVDVTTIPEEDVRADVEKFRAATDIFQGRRLINGVGFNNLMINIRDAGRWEEDTVPADEARDAVERIIAASPELAVVVAAREPDIAF